MLELGRLTSGEGSRGFHSPSGRRARQGRGGGGSGMDPRCLIDAVEFEVIPRLLGHHGNRSHWAMLTSEARDRAVPVADSIQPLTDRVLAQDVSGGLELVDGLRARGFSLDTIYTDLLGGVAKRLGAGWEEDELTFAEVTIGLCGLHQMLYRLSADFRDTGREGLNGRSALFVPAPQETHFFGVLMAADFFARAGWQVWTEVECDAQHLANLIREEDFDLVGFSISCDKYIDATGDTIGQLRAAMRRPLDIIVGGRAAVEAPDHMDRIGADIVASDAADGVRRAAEMLDIREAGDKTTGTVNLHIQK